ncbi:MAG: hypothetical protein JO185_21450 [Acidobacteriaceae bacterium]|nr:hypothetical protein [Acidobacteriaceae bacterium]
MVVYVESNFVLEHALHQEQCDSCEEIVKLAESKQISLALPALALAEPYQKLGVRQNSRRKLINHLSELKNLEQYKEIEGDFKPFLTALEDRVTEEQNRFKDTIGRLLETAAIIALDRPILESAIELTAKSRLKGQDAIMFASVLSHLRQIRPASACFPNRNSKDFDDPFVEEELKNLNCKYISNFNSGLDFINSRL